MHFTFSSIPRVYVFFPRKLLRHVHRSWSTTDRGAIIRWWSFQFSMCRLRTRTPSSDERHSHFSCTWDCYARLLTNDESLLSDVRNERTVFRNEKETLERKSMSRGNSDRFRIIFNGIYKRSALRRTNRRRLVLQVNSGVKWLIFKWTL